MGARRGDGGRRPRRGGGSRPSAPGGGTGRRRQAAAARGKLSLAEAEFYARAYDPARRGSLAELRRRGCDEHEAEELFAASYAKVMESVDPIERRFSVPQMVYFVKRACCRRLIDESRHRALYAEPEAEPPPSRPDCLVEQLAEPATEPSGEQPCELAEEREAVAAGREAMAMLPERDRLIFLRRHLLGMSPEEILAQTPGLSMRAYRKVLQRANARVLAAYGRIEAGERCAEMESDLLRRYFTGESDAAERKAVEAHLAHCRACRQAHARLRGYLIDVASGALLASSLGIGRAGTAALPARLLELASQGASSLGEASRTVRERVREVVLRFATSLPGPGADAGVSQALGTSSWRIASACTAAVAAGACVAAGVVPGVGVSELAVHHRHEVFPAKRGRAESPPPLAAPSEYAPPAQTASGSEPASSGTSAKRTAPAQRESSTPAPASGQQVATEFGPESSQSTPSSSGSSQGTSVSGATAAKGGGSGSGGSSKATNQSSAEFGL